MTDTNPSGESLAPAAGIPAPAASAETPAAATFGSSRGSGLARGKRSSSAPAPSATPVKADYKPTAVQVITATREYRNPFASPEPASAPASEPAKPEEPSPAPVAEARAEPASAPAPEAMAEPQPVRTPDEPPAGKPEIQILPPAENNRSEVRWESPSAAGHGTPAPEGAGRPQRDDRPTFRPERRPEPLGSAEGDRRDQRRDPYRGQPRDPRDEYPRRDTRAPAAAPAPAAEAPKGFLGWLKGLFGGAKPEAAPVQGRDPSQGEFGDGQRHRRRHRGGRRHGGGGGPQGFRDERGPQGGEFESRGGDRGPQGGDYESRGGGGGRRRRHRGGRGRDRSGEPRPEGHQGGGAI